ncbi:MAG: hypothetical protein K1X92_15775 [Bacteroidia bacterium]|nr:hypothetical protein [Bacteroidia bacterium]
MVNEGLAIPYRDSVVGHYFCKNELIVLDKFNGTEIWDTLDFNYREVLVDNDRISQRLIDSMYIDKKRRKTEMYRGKDSIVKYNSISKIKDMGFVFQQKSPPPRKLNHVIVAVRCKMIALIYRNFRIPKNFDYLEKGYSNLSGYYRGGFDNDCWKNLPQFGMHTPNMAFYFYADSFSMITQEQMAKLQWEKTPYKRIEIGH